MYISIFRSYKVECPVKIRLTRIENDSGYAYKVVRLCLTHENHASSSEVTSLYPENRRVELNDTVRAVCEMDSTRPMEIQTFLTQTTGRLQLEVQIEELCKWNRRSLVGESPGENQARGWFNL